MRGIVWYKEDINCGKKQLYEIKKKYERSCGIEVEVLEHETGMELNCSNGDKWHIRKAVPSPGRRCNVAYIQKGIPEEFIEECIIPCCNLAPYTAYHYYS